MLSEHFQYFDSPFETSRTQDTDGSISIFLEKKGNPSTDQVVIVSEDGEFLAAYANVVYANGLDVGYGYDVEPNFFNIRAKNKKTDFGELVYDETGIASCIEPEPFQDPERIVEEALTGEERMILIEEKKKLQSFFDRDDDGRISMDRLIGMTHLLFPNLKAYEQRLQRLSQYDRNNRLKVNWDKQRQKWAFVKTNEVLEVATADWNENIFYNEQLYTLSNSGGVLTFRQESGNGAKRKIIQAPLQVDYSMLLPVISSTYDWEKVFTLFPSSFYSEL